MKIEEMRVELEKLRAIPPSAEQVRLLNDLALLELDDDTGKAEAHSREALGIALDLKLDREQAISLHILGKINWTNNYYSKALAGFRQSLTIFSEIGDKSGISAVYDDMGSIYREQGFNDIALEHFLESLKLMEQCGDPLGTANAYIHIGDIYDQKLDSALALSSYMRAMLIFEEHDERCRAADCYDSIGRILIEQKDLDKALDYCRRALKQKEACKDSAGKAESHARIGTIHELTGAGEDALVSYGKSLEFYEQMTDAPGIAASCCRIGRLLLALDRLDEAEKVLVRGAAVAKAGTSGNLESETDCLMSLSLVYEAKNDLGKTLMVIKEHNDLRQEMISAASRDQFTRLQTLFETEIKERESEIHRLRSVELEGLVEQRIEELKDANKILRKEISERILAEEARVRAEATLRTFLDNVEDMVYYQATNGTISHLNSACAVVTGYNKYEYDRDPELWKRVLHPEDVESRLSILSSGQDGPLVSNQEYRLKKKDGEWCWIHSHMVAIRDSEDRITGYSCIDRDFTQRKTAEQKLQQSYDSLERSFQGTVFTIAKIVETRDPYTSGHQMRVAELARAIATHMELPEDVIQTIFLAAVVHDIGKICIPQELLSKPGKLNSIEMEIIRTHPRVSFEILSGIDFPWPIADIVLQHHEFFDGSGYPEGLSGEDIALEARVLCAADVVEAMSSHRPYRPVLGEESALEELLQNKGTRYDPAVVDACRELFLEENFKLPDYSSLII
jgi:PAS domain S-box-containing protein